MYNIQKFPTKWTKNELEMNSFKKERAKMGLKRSKLPKIGPKWTRNKKGEKKCQNVSKRAKNSQRLTEIHKKWTKVA